MSYFILPVTIESRKILFLTLNHNFDASKPLKNVGEDEYVVEIPPHDPTAIVSISLEKHVQSRHEEIDDIPLSEFAIDFKYNQPEKVLSVILDQTQPANNASSKKYIPLEDGLQLRIDRTATDISVMLAPSAHSGPINSDHFFINFHIKLKDEDFGYSAPIKLDMAHRNQIHLTGFDFGSEASQIKYKETNVDDDTDPTTADLFSCVRNHHTTDKTRRNEDYMQFDEAGLYRSIFYVKKEINWPDYVPHTTAPIPESEMNTLTHKSDLNVAGFTDTWVQIPNLKLIHKNDTITNSYTFTIKSSERTYSTNLTSLRNNIYAALMKEMILNHFKDRHILSDTYLRFTFLAPNIYNISQINETKKVIRSIILNPANNFAKFIKGLEISSLSESDSAFLGRLANDPINPGEYFILIDCGKGTTDFSVLQSQADNANIYKPIYRNGFAGAGNLITFAFIQSAMHFLEENALLESSANYWNFIKNGLPKGALNDIKHELFNAAEKWKRNHAHGKLKADIEAEWKAVSSGDILLENLFIRDRDPSIIMSLIEKPDHAYDWGGYIQSAINNIVSKIMISLEPAIIHMHKSRSRCGGILFTGRGFKFKPLKTDTLAALQRIKGMENAKVLDVPTNELKSVCLNGVFAKKNISYNDIVATPIEFNKKKLRQFTRADINSKSFWDNPLKFLKNIGKVIPDFVMYDQAGNKIEILNPDFNNVQFLIGGSIFEPHWTGSAHLEKAHLILSRPGNFIRARNGDDKVFHIELTRVVSLHKEFSEDSVIKSLFPGYYDPQMLKNTQ